MKTLEKELVKINRLNKLTLAKCVISLTGYYTEFKLYESALEIETDYKTAKTISELLSSMLGLDVDSGEFIKNKDEKSNELIDAYKSFRRELETSSKRLSVGEDILTSIVKELHDNSLVILPDIYLFYPLIIDSIQSYILGALSKSQLEERMVTKNLRGGDVKVSGSFFRRILMRVLKECESHIEDEEN